MGHFSLMNMQAAKFSTAMQMWEHLARIEQMISVKRTFQPLLLFQIFLGELNVHQIALFNTHTMLTGQDTAHFHTAAQDVCAKILSPLQLTRLVRIKQDQGMQIAITRMKHIGDTQPVFLAERGHSLHHIR